MHGFQEGGLEDSMQFEVVPKQLNKLFTAIRIFLSPFAGS